MREVLLPRTIDELWAILNQHPHASVYAGGTDLLVQIRLGVAQPTVLICLERVQELGGVRDCGSKVFIGATTTHSQLINCTEIRNGFPVLAKALGVIGSPAVRNMGTIGGNIVTASPAGDSLPALHVLDATVEIRSQKGARKLNIAEFILGPGKVALKKSEVVAGIWLTKDADFNFYHYEKVGLRNGLACSVVSMAAILKLTVEGFIERVRLAWGSVGPKIITPPVIERFLEGKPLSMETLKQAVPMIEETVSPIDDVRASAEYRRLVAGSLILRLLR